MRSDGANRKPVSNEHRRHFDEAGWYRVVLRPRGLGGGFAPTWNAGLGKDERLQWECRHRHNSKAEAFECAQANAQRRLAGLPLEAHPCPTCGRRDGHDLAIHSVIMRDATQQADKALARARRRVE